jgi:CubicO group peptidase (beta-lactamase class C family)
MLRLFGVSGFLVIALFAAVNLHAMPIDQAALDALVKGNQKADEPGVSVAISIDDDVVYEGWAGQADLAHNVPITADTRFPIASVTKQFTAFAILLLVNEGTLALDQNVREIIPEMQERATPVTIRHLLNHTGGLREANSLLLLTGQSEVSPVEQAQSLDLVYRQRGENFAAGERQEYSNTGYQLLAEIVERVSGQPFPQFLQERVFEPLGMMKTFVRSDSSRVIKNLATGYSPDAQGFALDPSVSGTYGASGIVSTPRDLLLWGDALNAGTIGGADVIQAMAARSTLPGGRRLIGTNGQEYRQFRGVETWSHGGTAGGFRSFLLRIPSARMSIVVMSNRSDFLKAAFAFDVASVVLSKQLEPEPEVQLVPETSDALDRYVGDYRLFAGVIFSLRRQGDDLNFATFGNGPGTPLKQIGKGVFELDPARELRLEFHDFADGRASELRWQVSDDGFIPAPRITMEPIPQTPLKPDALIGDYYSPSLQQVISVYEEKGALAVRTGEARRAPLERYQTDTFRPLGPSRLQKIEFVRDNGGRVTHALVSTALADNIEFRRFEVE